MYSLFPYQQFYAHRSGPQNQDSPLSVFSVKFSLMNEDADDAQKTKKPLSQF